MKTTSTLTKSQSKTFGPVYWKEKGKQYKITANVRYDDKCNNGHNSFAITTNIESSFSKQVWSEESGGCCHEEIAEHFPLLAPLIKWHGTTSEWPLHYIENTVYAAGDKDYNGLAKGEFRHFKSLGKLQNGGVEGVPLWVLKVPQEIKSEIYSHEKPKAVVVEWVAYGTTGKGKERDFKAARNSAVWPEATDEELSAPDLEQKLLARLPALMEEFKLAVESLGFTY